MKKILIIFFTLILMGCQETTELTLKIDYLEKQLDSIQEEQVENKESFESYLDSIEEVNQELMEQVERNENMFLVLEEIFESVLSYEYNRDKIYAIQGLVEHFSEVRMETGKLDSNLNLSVYMYYDPISGMYYDINDDVAIPLNGEVVLKDTNVILSLKVDKGTIYFLETDESFSIEDFIENLNEEDFVELMRVNENIVFLRNIGSGKRYYESPQIKVN